MRPLIQRHQIAAVAVLSAMLAFQACGWILVWWTARGEAYRCAQSAANHPIQNPQKLTLAAADFNLARVAKREIRWHGRLYDFRILKASTDSVALAVFPDEKEEQLIAALGALLGPVFNSTPTEHGKGSAPLCQLLSKWLGAPFLTPQLPAVPGARERQQKGLFTYSFILHTVNLNRPGPPPKA